MSILVNRERWMPQREYWPYVWHLATTQAEPSHAVCSGPSVVLICDHRSEACVRSSSRNRWVWSGRLRWNWLTIAWGCRKGRDDREQFIAYAPAVKLVSHGRLHASMNICTGCKWRAGVNQGALRDQHEAHVARALAERLVGLVGGAG